MTRFIALGFALVLAGASLALAHQTTPPPADPDTAKLGQDIDDVVLTDEAGKATPWQTLKGAPRAVFFGFTKCPVVCPVTMVEIEGALSKIGAPGERVAVQFVSLDPARDRPDVLKSYFSSFKRVKALTGSEKDIDRVAQAFAVKYEKVKSANGDYTIDHTAAVFLLNESGQVVDMVAYGAPSEVFVERMTKLVTKAEPNSSGK